MKLRLSLGEKERYSYKSQLPHSQPESMVLSKALPATTHIKYTCSLTVKAHLSSN